MNQSESPKEVSMPPTLEAVNMKREQNSLQDKQIVSLLDRRRQLNEANKQNDADLLFVGYHPPMEALQPKRMTEAEWDTYIEKSGGIVCRKDFLNEVRGRAAKYERAYRALKKKIKNSYVITKPVKKSSSKKK